MEVNHDVRIAPVSSPKISGESWGKVSAAFQNSNSSVRRFVRSAGLFMLSVLFLRLDF